MSTVRISRNYIYNSLVNGDGVRFVIFFAGCKFRCKNCHNKNLQDINSGVETNIKDIIEMIKENMPLIDGVTLSGGDPLFQEESLIPLLDELNKLEIDITIYTGELFENIDNRILDNCHSIVDGEFVEALLDDSFINRGSTNQRIFRKNNDIWKCIVQ